MDDPNITMEEYIRLEEEKAQRHGQTFNWQTATFGKVENYEDGDVCSIDFEIEFPTIVFDNTLTAIPSEPTVCPPNKNKIDFRISFDESNDEDYTVIFDENSFLYKITSVNDLKTDLENDNNKMPLSPNPTIDYFDDLDYFKDFENEFPAIIYNDGLMSKSDPKPLVNSKRIDEFNLINETSLSEYDEEIVSRFNDLFNIIHSDDSKSEKDNDDNEISIMQSSEGDEITHWENDMAPLPAADQRYPWLRYQIEKYTEGIMHRSGSEVEDGIFWRGAAGILESCLEETVWDPSTFGPGQAPEKVTSIDLFYLCSIDRGTTNVPHLLAQYLFSHSDEEEEQGQAVVTRELSFIDLHELGRLNICTRYGETWTLVDHGPKRQQAATAGAHEAGEAGPAAEEVALEIPAQAPPPPSTHSTGP
ncbi:hypothetical protein Tco_0033325 [Tanacetum coccineum]